MSEKLLTNLQNIGYNGPLLKSDALELSLNEGPKDIEFTNLVNFLTNELKTLLSIDEEVNPITCHEDAVIFVMETTSFLKELNCPYLALMHGHISDRLQTVEDRLLLLDYLICELMAARISHQKKLDTKLELKLDETEEAANMKTILQIIRFPKPPANITLQQLFQKLTPTIENILKKTDCQVVGNPAFQGVLSDKQWDVLEKIHKDLNLEYKIRREMLLTRLDVTIQSFQWSKRSTEKDNFFEKVYADKRISLKSDPQVDIADFMSAKDDIAIVEKTSNSTVRKHTRSSLNKVIIGKVPDRGGRTSEQAPPPPEMPSWQQRKPGPSFGNNRNFDGQNRNSQYSQRNDNYQSSQGRYNDKNFSHQSAGGYSNRDSNPGNFSQNQNVRDNNYGQNSKRFKTYDSFQSNRSTYADQYTREEQQNQRHHGNNRGEYQSHRGKSNYSRNSYNKY